MVDILFHQAIGIISLVASITALYYTFKLSNGISGGLGKGYRRIAIGIIFIILASIILNLMDYNFIALEDSNANISIDLFIAIAAIFIASGVSKLAKILEFMPKVLINHINKYF